MQVFVLLVAPLAVVLFLSLRNEPPAGPSEPHAVGPGTATNMLLALALASAGAGFIHAAVIPEHLRESGLFGAFFAVSALFQALWAAAIYRRPSRGLLWAGIAGNAAIAALWLLSRTVGIPVGPAPWVAEPVSPPDALATLYEVGIAILGTVLLRARGPTPRPGRVLPAFPTTVLVAASTLVIVVGGHGH